MSVCRLLAQQGSGRWGGAQSDPLRQLIAQVIKLASIEKIGCSYVIGAESLGNQPCSLTFARGALITL